MYEIHIQHCPQNSFGVWSWTTMSGENFHHDRQMKICPVKSKKWHGNTGRVGNMCSFKLQYIFPPSITLRGPRCAANETPFSGQAIGMKIWNLCVYVCAWEGNRATSRRPHGHFSPRSVQLSLIDSNEWICVCVSVGVGIDIFTWNVTSQLYSQDH